MMNTPTAARRSTPGTAPSTAPGAAPPPLTAAAFTAAGAKEPLRHSIAIPGCKLPLVVERETEGRLLTLSAGGRIYVDARQAGHVDFDGGFVLVHTIELPGGLLRRVRLRGSAAQQWTERYGWDARGRLVDVDGVAIEHDALGRVTACIDRTDPRTAWHYGYSGEHLTVIQTPQALRHVLRGDDGRAVGWREGPHQGRIAFTDDGRRLPTRSTPLHWHLDASGRLLALFDEQRRVVRTFLWDGWFCLGAIDGEPGEPLAEVYSLDPGGTPVRVAGRHGMRRLPRDAYGEGLLQARAAGPQIPGLFGGAIDTDGLVHLPWRRLDPRLASFDCPDPLDGEARDPRRASGWAGPLQIELPAAGTYTVCRHNPVSLADPTGAISDLWWLIPSALTWSMQNTIGSLLGMWLNLQFSPLGWIVSAAAGAKPFDVEWISANNHDAFGLRADGWLSRIQPVAWTYQFLVNEEKAPFTALEDARLFSPDEAFRPTLYGTLLRCAPQGAAGFVLRGTRGGPNTTALPDWSRCGGSAEAAVPGSLQPVFPAGGLHFDTVQRGLHQQRGEMIEVAPAAAIVTGVAGSFASLSVPGTGLGLAVDADLRLTDPAGVFEVVRVLSATELGASTMLRVDPALTRLGAGALRLQGLTAAAGTEALTPVPGEPRLLVVAGSSLDYVPALSVLRLARAGAAVHVATVEGLQARLALDAAVPAALGADFRVRAALASGSFNGAIGPTPTQYTVQSGTAPGVGSGILVGSGAAALPAIVMAVAGPLLTLDRDLAALGAAGAAVPWQQLAAAAELGVHGGAPEATAVLTYAPAAPGVAPSSGFVWLQGATAAVRRVTGLNHDALVLSHERPDAQPDAYDVSRWRLGPPPDIAAVTGSQIQTIALSAALQAGATALHVMSFQAATVTAGPLLFAAGTLQAFAAGTPATVTTSITAGVLTGRLRVGDVVVVAPAAGPAQAAVVRRLRLTVKLGRNVALGTGPIEASLLAADAQAYAATRLDGLVLRLAVPVVGTQRLDMPRFVAGELMWVNFTDAGTPGQRHYRVAAVAGATLTLLDDDPLPATASAISVNRLQVTDPGTGSARWGIEGAVVAPDQLVFSVWNAGDGLNQRRLALVEGGVVHAVRLSPDAQPLVVELALASGAAALAGNVLLAAPPAASVSGVFGSFVVDGATLTLPSALIPDGQIAAVVPYVDTARRVAGELHPGSVRIPDDHENQGMQLTRRQSLEDHELMHTVQSARLGPIMLVAFPLWALELANDLTAAGGPEFSPYGPGALAAGKLTPADAAGFAQGGKVQVAQNRRVVTVTLGSAATGGGFNLSDGDRRSLGSAGFADGAAQLRRALTSTGNDVLDWVNNIGQLLTIGGLMNVVSIAGWGGLAAIIVQIVQAIRHTARSGINVPLSADRRTLTLAAGQSLEGLARGVQVALKSGDQIFIRSVASVSDRIVMLDAEVPLSGEVELSVYSPGSALFGLRSFFPATVPDADRPARLLISAAGGDTLSLAVHDRVEVRAASGSAYRTLVTRVDGAAVELEDAALVRQDQPNEFLIGKIAAEDPSGWLDGWLLNELHLGWMQYLHDPWGQILYRTQPAADNIAGQIFARSARYLFGTQSWMCCFLGYFWNDNAYQRKNPHRSKMEQEASRRSGDTYCPLGTLHGDVTVVGDVARYWLTGSGGGRDGDANTPTDMIAFGLQDAPRVNLVQSPTLTVATPAPFPAALPAPFALPDDLYAVNHTPPPPPPLPPGTAVPPRLGELTAIGPRGWVPTDNVLERSAAIHVAFTRPAPAGNPYRITAQAAGGVSRGELANSIDAQSNGVATLFFDRSPLDVAVSAAGVAVAEAGTPLALLPFQRLRFEVLPNGNRVYRVTVAGQGQAFDCDGLTLTARGALTAQPDDAEISRFHRFDPGSGLYDSGIGPIHLAADLHIAVRRFQVRVTDTLPLRVTADHAAAPLASLQPGGTGFVLVPSALAPVPVAVVVAGALAVIAPLVPAAQALSAETTAFLGDGAAFQLTLPADEPPEATVTVTVTVSVGPDATTAVPVRCTFELAPHFTLDSATGFTVARGATITLTSSDGSVLQAQGAPAGLAFTPAGASLQVAVGAAHPPGPVTLRASDAANATRQARRVITVT